MIVKNNSGSEITLSGLGFTIADGATQDLFEEDNIPSEVYGDTQTRELLDSGDLAVYFEDAISLNTSDSIVLFNGCGCRPITRVSGDPTVNDDINKGFSAGDEWVNTDNDGIWKLHTNVSGAAVWVLMYPPILAGTAILTASVSGGGAYVGIAGDYTAFVMSSTGIGFGGTLTLSFAGSVITGVVSVDSGGDDHSANDKLTVSIIGISQVAPCEITVDSVG